MASFLPDPAFGDNSNTCLRCAYPLEGMPDAGCCPECGLPFHAAADTLVLHGVARSQEVVAWRRAVWIILAVLTFFFVQFIILLFAYNPLYAGIFAMALLAAIVGMVLTGAPRRRGTERFVITPSGLSRHTLGSADRPAFILWDGPVHTDLRKISPVWRRLRLATIQNGRPVRHLDAGIRCPEEDLPEVRRLLAALAGPPNQAAAPSPPPASEDAP